ncbi:MAG: MFS transporter, partial [Nanoarchaeota archaeon]|nr:MFS transporter [Nanoarchaeota archaeon]
MVSKRIENLRHKSRRLSIKEGIFASAKGSFGDYYISPFAIAINSSNSVVAMFSAISGLLGPITQMFSSKLIGKHSRKEIILKSILFESLIWLPMILLAFLFYKGILVSALPLFLLLIYSLYIILANIGGPAWFSWMGDIVDENKRGLWFSKRNLIIGFTSITLALAASFFLDYFKSRNWTLFGFMTLFALAFLARITTRRIIKKQYEPKIKVKKEDCFSFYEFITRAPKTNFGKFSIFRAFFSFASSISSPLLAVYLLRNIGFDYKTYMIIILAGAALSLLFMEIWGKIADQFGNYVILKITAIPIAILPILWILSPSPIYLIAVPSIISGITWAGFGLSSGNFIYDNVSPQKRGIAVSYYNMMYGIGAFLGAGLGAILIKVIKTDLLEPIFIIFIISAIARIIVVLFGLPKIKEIRKVKKSHGRKALDHMIFKEVKPTILEEIHEIRSIGGRV